MGRTCSSLGRRDSDIKKKLRDIKPYVISFFFFFPFMHFPIFFILLVSFVFVVPGFSVAERSAVTVAVLTSPLWGLLLWVSDASGYSSCL